MHGLVADYDARVGAAEIEAALARCGDMRPQLYCRSLSGNARFYWLFKEPLLVAGNEDCKILIAALAKQLELSKILPGLDAACGADPKKVNPCQYYTNSCEWLVIKLEPTIPQELLVGWRIDAARSAREKVRPEIPLEVVREELAKHWPKLAADWKDKVFDLGATGSRFWDPASRPTARSCIVRAGGMQAFCGLKAWLPWSELLPKEFVARYSAGVIGEACKDLWYDGKFLWSKVPHEIKGSAWHAYHTEDIKLYLSQEKSLDPEEVKEALNFVKRNRIIRSAHPVFYKPRGAVYWEGDHRYLNIALSEPYKPGPQTGIQWNEQDLGWIFNFYNSFFVEREQLDLFLSWLSRYFKGLLQGDPLSNLILFLAGPPGRGKNLSSEIVQRLVGGSCDAGAYLLQQDSFNGELFQYPFWRVDDATALSSESEYRKYSSVVKKIAANQEFRSRALYENARMIRWMGIVIVTLNTDAESVRMLPDIDTSLLDKSVFLRTSDRIAGVEFVAGKAQITEIEKWLPNFARFLLEYKIPTYCEGVGAGKARYGIRSFQDEQLLQAAKQSSAANAFLEILRMYLTDYFRAHKKDNPEVTAWRGNASELYRQMCQDASMAATVRNLNASAIGRQLAKLAAQGHDLQLKQTSKQRLWVIGKDAKFLQEDYEAQELEMFPAVT